MLTISGTLERIAPKDAKEYLESASVNGIKNRNIMKAVIDRFASDMTNGYWKVNGEPIIFDEKGFLLDGQHRLAAIVKAGISIPTMVVRGINRSSFDTIDSGKTRSFNQVLACRGEKMVSELGSALKLLARIEDSILQGKPLGSFGKAYSNSYLEELLNKNGGIRNCVPSNKDHRKVMASSTITALRYLFNQKSPDESEVFFNDLVYGLDLEQTDYVYILRESLLEFRGRRDKTILRSEVVVNRAIKTWNAMRIGKSPFSKRTLTNNDDPTLII